MPEARETPIAMQADNITTLPGGGIRLLTAVVNINGIPTPVQMQVITLAGADGAVLDISNYNFDSRILAELKDIRKLLALQMGVPAFEDSREVGEAGMGY